MVKNLLLLLNLSLVLQNVLSARILAMFPTPSISHQVVFRPFTQELARRGHDVVVITTDPAFPSNQTPANFKEIDLHQTYEDWRKFAVNVDGNSDDFYVDLRGIFFVLANVVEQQLRNNEVQELLKDKTQKFDLIVLEAYVRPALVLSHFYKAPVIQISTVGATIYNNDAMGISNHPILQPTLNRKRIYNLTMWEKIEELIGHYKMVKIFEEVENEENAVLKRVFGHDTPDISELVNNVDMLFLNVHPIWEDNPSVPPSVVFLGALHVQPEKKLPEVNFIANF